MGWELFTLSVLAYAVVPMLVAIRTTAFQFVLLYAHLSAMLVVAGFFGSIYSFELSAPLLGTLTVTNGEAAYAAFGFTTLIATIIGRDLQVVRNVIVMSVSVNLLLLAVYLLGDQVLAQGWAESPLDVSPRFFEQSALAVLWGGLLLMGELLLLLGVLEWAKRRLVSLTMVVVYPTAYVGVLLLDGLLHPLGAGAPSDLLARVGEALAAKSVLGTSFGFLLLLFATLYRSTVTDFEERPLELGQVLSLQRDELLLGRATATVERILDSATNTLLIVLDPDLRITHFNAGAEHVLGFTAERMRGRTTGDLVTVEEGARHAQALGVDNELHALTAAVVRDGGKREWELIDSEGRPCVVSLSISEISSGGRVVGYLAAGEDVTSKVRAERAMMLALQRESEAKQRLHEADTVKHELVSTVSHELRTPITSITGYAELLGEGVFGELNERQVTALGKVMRNTERLEKLVEDLLVLERVESGNMTFDRAPLDLRDVVKQVDDMLVEMVRGRDLHLQVRLGDEPLVVSGDRSALERVVLNLVSNAAKFTPGGGEITVQAHRNDERGMLLVSDTGIGISTEDQERLFTRFFRTEEASSRAIPGSGLGLSIIHAIVTGHDGQITVLSAPGRGTTMAVGLPLLQVPSPLGAQGTHQAAWGATPTG